MNSFSTTQLSDAQPDLRNKERSLFFLKKKGNAFATFTIVFFGIVLLLFALYWGDFLEQRRVLWKNFFQTESDISTEHQKCSQCIYEMIDGYCIFKWYSMNKCIRCENDDCWKYTDN